MKANKIQTIKGAFQSWHNGGTQISAIYLTSEDGQDRVDSFIEQSQNCQCTLHTFTSEEECRKEYNEYEK